MRALIFILPIYAALFFLYGTRNFKRFLLLTGIITLPFRMDYLIYGGSEHAGWSSGVIIALSDISFIMLIGYLIVTMRNIGRASLKIIVPSIFFICACILSLINSVAGALTLFQVVLLSKLLILYYIVTANCIESKEDLHFVTLALTISLLFQGLLGCAQFATGYEFDMFSTGEKVGELFGEVKLWGSLRRVFGTQLGRPNSYASYLAPLLLLNSVLLLGIKRYVKLRWAACLFGFLGLLLSFSRGGWVSFTGGAIALIIYLVKTRVKLPKVVYIAVVAGLIGVIIFLPLLKVRVTHDPSNAAASRIPLIKLAMNMIKEYPIFGVGGNTFSNVIKRHITADLRGVFLYQVHNQYLLVLAETGTVGLLCFLWLLYSIFKMGLNCIRRKDNDLARYIGLGAIIGFIAILLHMMVDLYTSRLQIGSLYLTCAILTAALKLPPDVEHEEKPAQMVEELV